MSIAFERLCLTVPFAMPDVHELSVWIGVGGLGGVAHVSDVANQRLCHYGIRPHALLQQQRTQQPSRWNMEHGTWTFPLMGGGGAFGSMVVVCAG
jgi:hypothetical protein